MLSPFLPFFFQLKKKNISWQIYTQHLIWCEYVKLKENKSKTNLPKQMGASSIYVEIVK
jgi:hypothetical protein